MTAPYTYLSADDTPALLAEIERLKAENAAIRKEKADLEVMMEMASVHADEIGADMLDRMDASIRQSEERVRLLSETIPVPVVISRVSDGKFLYANEHSCRVFGLSADEFLKRMAVELYADPADRRKFVNILKEHKHTNNFQVRLRKSDGSIFWAALFSQPLNFRNEPCQLTVIYDLTERREAEEKIRRLTEALERAKEREEKYLMFTLAGEEYGISLQNIKEIIGIMPITPVPNMPDFIKGVGNLRGRVIPIADLRPAFGIPCAEYTERTCIIVSEIEDKTKKGYVGIIVDSVTEVLGIKGRDIEPPPKLDSETDMRFISGMAKAGGSVKILLDIAHLREKFYLSMNAGTPIGDV
jgi:purine-binding chemotaxis protein CheW